MSNGLSFVVHYTIEEKTSTSGKTVFHSDKQGHKYLAVKKPINQLKAASALNRIMVLCDNTLILLNMFDLEPIVSGAKIKGVTCFCINENPAYGNPFSVEICVALKKKQLQFYTVTEDRLVHIRDISVSEPAVALGLDGSFVCVALSSQYCMINFETAHIQDLFPFDGEQNKPLILRISKEEFLLSGPSALGMFVTSDGISQRPPLQCILDQHQKQAIPFQGGTYLGNFDGRLFIASGKEIYSLVPVAWEKQVISLYPKLLPTNTSFTRSIQPLHEIADINQLCRGQDSLLTDYKTFLRLYLEDIRGTKEAIGFKQEIDIALLKLYAEVNSPELIPLIAVDTGCDLKDCVDWLEKYNRYHALALLYKYHSENDKALHIWTRLVNGEIKDEAFPGLQFVIEYLSNLTDHELVWKYVDWILEKDPENGVKALFNTLSIYCIRNFRSKLRHMLQISNLYRVQLILGKAKEQEMHAECAILYGKLEEHDKALRILVHKLKDFGGAENYCIVNSQGKDPSYRKRLFHALLSVYLDPSYE
ncbi:hypothetical protein KUTeg_023728 [Tegillarca granosa]|uniref:CNH domain-containing protein n=1 Tax=Tegillarca granosa TaxID=220873 RepID=A0ABQ9E8M7_TEGGR|nr:hypothetical protein KUTeg_023728 [Tegillarca granosa]